MTGPHLVPGALSLHGTLLDGVAIRVEAMRERGPLAAPSRPLLVFVGNLPSPFDRAVLRGLFAQYGPVVRAKTRG